MTVTIAQSRRPAVAGTFYPGNPVQLRAEVDRLLAAAQEAGLTDIKALIVPHAGYRYSGPVAASGFRQLQNGSQASRTVYLLGPAHYVYVDSVALAPFQQFETPLGPVKQNLSVIEEMLGSHPAYEAHAPAHMPEHSLEVELPFLQTVLDDFRLVAMLCGRPPIDQVAADLSNRLQPNDLVIVSSDLSHFYTYEEAQALDRQFLKAVLAGDMAGAARGEACGLQPILILMQLAQLQGWQPTLLDYRNSGDTGGDRLRVVGYAAVAYTEQV